MQIHITKITSTHYSFKAEGFEYYATANADTGKWNIPSFVASDFHVLQQNPAKLVHSQVIQFLKKNPLYLPLNKIDGATNKRIFKHNPVFN